MSTLRMLAALGPGPRRLLLASGVNNFGSGLVLPLLMAYVRELGLDVWYGAAAVTLTSLGVAVGAPLAGWAADRWGRFRTVAVALGLSLTATILYATAEQPSDLLIAGLLLGFGVGGNSAWFTILAESVTAAQRPIVFGANTMVISLALGVGGAVAGLSAHSGELSAFRTLYLANGLTYVLTAVLIMSVRRRVSIPRKPWADTHGGGFVAVLRTPGLRPLAFLAFMTYLCGFSQLEVAYPEVILRAGLGPGAVATGFAVNTVVVVVGQLFMLHRIHARSPFGNVAAFALAWAVAWAVLLGVVGARTDRTVLLLACACMAAFAVGEWFYGVSLPTLVNNLAEDSIRGRMNGVVSVATSMGYIVGPLMTAQLFVTGGSQAVAGVLTTLCLLMALYALALSRRSGARSAERDPSAEVAVGAE